MMKKDECKTAIRSLCGEWAKACGISISPTEQPSFYDFKSWMSEKGHGLYLNFRSDNPDSDAERWFDEVFKQTWRN